MNVWTVTGKELLKTIRQPLQTMRSQSSKHTENAKQGVLLASNTQYIQLHLSRLIITVYALVPIELSNLLIDILTNPHPGYRAIYNTASLSVIVTAIVYIYLCGWYLQGRYASKKAPWIIYHSFWYIFSCLMLAFIVADYLEREAFNNTFLLYIIITIIPTLSRKSGTLLFLFNILATTMVAVFIRMPLFLIQQILVIGITAYLLSRFMSNTTLRNFLLQQSLETMNKTLKQLSITDPLTGLYNRRKADEQLEHIWNERTKDDRLTIFALDVDHFKEYNDTYGHLAGDECLTGVARILSEAIRQFDGAEAYRTGGEEFLIIAKRLDDEQALAIARQIREQVEQLSIFEGGRLDHQITISIGIASCSPQTPEQEDSYQRLWKQADTALYKAKAFGRNKIAFGELITQ